MIDQGQAPEPVVGLHAVRTFRVSADGRLLPVAVTTSDWATGACIARCGRSHQAPALDCTCGIYSFAGWRDLRAQYPSQSRRLIAVIALEGVTVEGTRGYRSQAARVLELWLRPGRRGLPADSVAQLRSHYPEVRFAESLPDMVARYPELPDPAHPRRELLARGARAWWAGVRRCDRGRWRWWAIAVGTVAAVLLTALSVTHPGVGADAALASSAVLGSTVLLLMVAEVPAQVAVLLRAGVSPPLQFLSRRPARSVGTLGLPLAVGGGLAALTRPDGGSWRPALVLAAGWVVMIAVESFAATIAPVPAPLPRPVPGEGPLVQPRGIAAAPPTSRRRWDSRGIVPVTITVLDDPDPDDDPDPGSHRREESPDG